MRKRYLLPVFLLIMCGCSSEQTPLLDALMSQRGGIVSQVYTEAEKFEVQILYTQIDRDENNQPTFTSHEFRVNNDAYFYPASTVKLPAAILALEKLKSLNISGLDRETHMLTDSAFSGQSKALTDSSSKDFKPSIAHYIKKILLVSDNDAFNRLYEFLGQGPFNQKMHEKGYTETKISHRLSIFLSEEENRNTNPIKFYSEGKLLYDQAAAYNEKDVNTSDPILKGKGEIQGGELVSGPKDFSTKNVYPLRDQRQVLLDVLFPNGVMGDSGVDLLPQDRKFLLTYMSMLPRESQYPAYNDSSYYDGYVKFFMYGDTQEPIPASVRIFNKVGNAYGYLTDNAYIIDLEKGVEFLLAATVFVNENQIFNDNNYEYDEIGYPFLADLGRMIYEYEVERKKEYPADLSEFSLDYY